MVLKSEPMKYHLQHTFFTKSAKKYISSGQWFWNRINFRTENDFCERNHNYKKTFSVPKWIRFQNYWPDEMSIGKGCKKFWIDQPSIKRGVFQPVLFGIGLEVRLSMAEIRSLLETLSIALFDGFSNIAILILFWSLYCWKHRNSKKVCPWGWRDMESVSIGSRSFST